jgi:hypothetical protein
MTTALRSSASMAAVVAIKDEQLLALAQTSQCRGLRLVRGRMLGQHVVVLGRNDPASACAMSPWLSMKPGGHARAG